MSVNIDFCFEFLAELDSWLCFNRFVKYISSRPDWKVWQFSTISQAGIKEYCKRLRCAYDSNVILQTQ